MKSSKIFSLSQPPTLVIAFAIMTEEIKTERKECTVTLRESTEIEGAIHGKGLNPVGSEVDWARVQCIRELMVGFQRNAEEKKTMEGRKLATIW